MFVSEYERYGEERAHTHDAWRPCTTLWGWYAQHI